MFKWIKSFFSWCFSGLFRFLVRPSYSYLPSPARLEATADMNFFAVPGGDNTSFSSTASDSHGTII